MLNRFEVYADDLRPARDMRLAERLRAVIALQQEVVAADLDADALARLVAERASELTGGEAIVDLGVASAAGNGDGLCVPLNHGRRLIGMLRMRGPVADEDAELLELISGVVAAQLLHASDYARCRREGRVDPLTGLLNRRAYDETLERETARARRHGRELALCLFDLDDFKAVNDSNGHLAGDDVLRGFAATLRQGRGEDCAFRVGGDEFALVLPETGRAGAEVVAARVLAAADAPASGGIATLADALDPLGLHAAADAELYGAKRRR